MVASVGIETARKNSKALTYNKLIVHKKTVRNDNKYEILENRIKLMFCVCNDTRVYMFTHVFICFIMAVLQVALT